ncbi:MAG: DUF4031 domain-containing protein [Nocardioides sp.]
MTVYVDDMLLEASVRNRRNVVRGRWSHLMADDSDELRVFAARLGLRRSWIQKAGTPLEHFDITAGKRHQAIALGAVEISYGEGGHLTLAKRAGVPFDLDQLRNDPAGFTARVHAAREVLLAAAGDTAGPRRVQLSRASGFTLPPHTVSVAAPTRWANPYRPARSPEDNAAAVDHFRQYLARNPELVVAARRELVGLNLACWCRPALACHADVWLVLANPAAGGTLPHPLKRGPKIETDAATAKWGAP